MKNETQESEGISTSLINGVMKISHTSKSAEISAVVPSLNLGKST